MVATRATSSSRLRAAARAASSKKALTGEGLPLMRCAGQGDVFLADLAGTCTC